MARVQHRDWGTDDRPWTQRHPTLTKVLGLGIAAGAGYGLLRHFGASLAQGTETFLRRELSRDVLGPDGKRVRQGLLYSFGSFLEHDAAGNVVARQTDLQSTIRFALRQRGSADHVGEYQRLVATTRRVQHLATSLDLAGRHELTAPELAAARQFAENIDILREGPDWLNQSEYRPLRDLVARRTGATTLDEIHDHLLRFRGHWNTEEQFMAQRVSLQGFDAWFAQHHQHARRRAGIFDRILGLQHAEATPESIARLEGYNPEREELYRYNNAVPRGAQIDRSIFQDANGGLVDLRVSRQFLRGLGHQISDSLQFPTIPYLQRGINPLRMFSYGEEANVALHGVYRLGDIQPGLHGKDGLIDPHYMLGNTAWQVNVEGEIWRVGGEFRRVSTGNRMASVYATLQGLGSGREQQLPGILGQLGNLLDIGRQEHPSALTRVLSRITKFNDPEWAGNLVRRIWIDPQIAEPLDHVQALRTVFDAASDFDTQSIIAKQLEGYGAQLTGSQFSFENTDNLRDLFALFNGNTDIIRSRTLRGLTWQGIDDLLLPRNQTRLRDALAEELILQQIAPETAHGPATVQRNVINALIGRPGVSDSATQLTGLLTGSLESEGSRAFATRTLLHTLDDENSGALISVLRAHESTVVRSQLEEFAYKAAFPLFGEYRSSDYLTTRQLYNGGSTVAIPEAGPLLGSSVQETLTNINERIHSLAGVTQDTATVGLLSPFERAHYVNQHLEHVGLGLSAESFSSPGSAWWNLLSKRVAPYMIGSFYAGYAAWELRNFMNLGDEEGNRPGPFANIRANLGIAASWVKEHTGLNALGKVVIDYVPGMENYLHPRSVDEYKEYLRSGYDPVRAGAGNLIDEFFRFRLFGRSPIYGERVTRFEPNWYAKDAADVDYSRSGLTREESYRYAWLPTPRNPLAPLQRLVDPYFWEDIHRSDRPYPVSGDLFSGAPTVLRPLEMLANATVGAVIKPQVNRADLYTQLASQNRAIHARARLVENGDGGEQTVAPGVGGPGVLRVTPGGMTSVNARVSGELTAINEGIHGRAAVLGQYRTAETTDYFTDETTGSIATPGLGYRASEALYTARHYTGILGTLARIAGENLDIDLGPTHMWAQAHAGYGGYVDQDIEYVNPYLNRMPAWLGGSSYRDWRHGDPYAKIPGGEYRLPGHGYEKLYRVQRQRRAATVEMLSLGDDDLTQALLGGTVPGADPVTLANKAQRAKQVREAFQGIENRREMALDILVGGDWRTLLGPSTPRGSTNDLRLTGNVYLHIGGAEDPRRVYINRQGWLGKTVRNLLQQRVENATDTITPYGQSATPQWQKPQTMFRRFVNEILGDFGVRLKERVVYPLVQRGQVARNIRLYDPRSRVEGVADLVLEEHAGLARHLIPVLLRDAPGSASYDAENGPRTVQLTDDGVAEQDALAAQFASSVTRSPYAYVVYGNPQTRSQVVKRVRADRSAVRDAYRRLDAAREREQEIVRDPTHPRGTWYSDLDKFRILADVDPYSDATKALASKLSATLEPDSPAWEQFQAIKDRMTIQKKKYETHPYRFLNQDELKHARVTVDRILDPNTFTTLEDPDHPVRLAGIRVSQQALGDTKANATFLGRIQAMVAEAHHQLLGEYGERLVQAGGTLLDAGSGGPLRSHQRSIGRKALGLITWPFTAAKAIINAGLNPTIQTISYQQALDAVGIRPGAKVSLLSDPSYGNDLLDTNRSIVYTHGHNVNRELLNRGWAKEARRKHSPVETQLFYSPFGRMLGRLGERIAHSDTPFNTKFLRTRSALEEMERSQIYGTTSGSWAHPIRDWVVPTIESYWHKHPLKAAVGGAFFAGMLWQSPGAGQWGFLHGKDNVRLGFMAVGAAVGLLGSIATRMLYDKDHPWIPKRRRKEFALDEYFDTLDYVKSAKYYEKYKSLARNVEGIDIDALMREYRERGFENKEERQQLEQQKKRLVLDGYSRKSDEIRSINRRLGEISEDVTLHDLPENAAKAVAYREAMQKTMYGMPDSATLGERLAVLPRKHRQLIQDVLQTGSEREKRAMARLLPETERRIIGQQLDPTLSVEQRQDLVEYFKSHFLPRESWAGWDEDQSFEPAAAKELKRMGLDPRSAGPMFHRNYRAGLRHPLAVGPFNHHNLASPAEIREALHRTLGEHVSNLSVDVIVSPGVRPGGRVQMHLQCDRSEDLRDLVNR